MTEPSGRRSGSAAAIPACTLTPAEVVWPLQYAVATNSTRAPAAGMGEGETRRATLRESITLALYSRTKLHAASTVARTFRRNERDSSITPSTTHPAYQRIGPRSPTNYE